MYTYCTCVYIYICVCVIDISYRYVRYYPQVNQHRPSQRTWLEDWFPKQLGDFQALCILYYSFGSMFILHHPSFKRTMRFLMILGCGWPPILSSEPGGPCRTKHPNSATLLPDVRSTLDIWLDRAGSGWTVLSITFHAMTNR